MIHYILTTRIARIILMDLRDLAGLLGQIIACRSVHGILTILMIRYILTTQIARIILMVLKDLTVLLGQTIAYQT